MNNFNTFCKNYPVILFEFSLKNIEDCKFSELSSVKFSSKFLESFEETPESFSTTIPQSGNFINEKVFKNF